MYKQFWLHPCGTVLVLMNYDYIYMYNKVLGIMNYFFFYPMNSKICGKEPTYNETLLWQTVLPVPRYIEVSDF